MHRLYQRPFGVYVEIGLELVRSDRETHFHARENRSAVSEDLIRGRGNIGRRRCRVVDFLGDEEGSRVGSVTRSAVRIGERCWADRFDRRFGSCPQERTTVWGEPKSLRGRLPWCDLAECADPVAFRKDCAASHDLRRSVLVGKRALFDL